MLNPNIELRETPGKGKGLFATALIRGGDVIWADFDLLATEIRFTEAELKLMAEWIVRHAYWNGSFYVWHPTDEGNYMNHSCDPNVWHSGELMVARRNIQLGEEVVYDYATCEIEPPDAVILAECMCGAINCRHVINTSDLFTVSGLADLHRGHLPGYVEAALKLRIA